jgi:hypothetical protein
VSRLVCPQCGHVFSGGVWDLHAGKGHIPTPEPGGLLLCAGAGCRRVLIYEEPAGTGLREITAAELAQLPQALRDQLEAGQRIYDLADRRIVERAERKGPVN